jgi:hypothetical protein
MPDWTTYKGQTPWENPVMRKKTSYNEGALIADSRNPVWQYPEWRTTPVTDKHLPCGYWDAKQNARDARVVFNITPPVGYDTWTCDGVEYQGKIYEFGPGKTYEQFYQASISAGVYNPKLLLFYPGDYYGQNPGDAPLSLFHGSSSKFESWFVRGVGPIEDIIMHGSNQTIMAGGYANTVIEGLHIKQTDYYSFHGYPIFSSGNYYPSSEKHIYNKILLSEQETTTHFWQVGFGILDIRYCSILTNATTSMLFWDYPYYGIYNDNTLSSVINTYFAHWAGISNGSGLPTPLDYVSNPTVGYGHEYGDYLISDWEFDGTKRKLSYEGGTAVDVSAGGYFTLTNTKREFINVYVEAASLPSVDRTLTIYNDRYTDGVKII